MQVRINRSSVNSLLVSKGGRVPLMRPYKPRSNEKADLAKYMSLSVSLYNIAVTYF